MTLPINLAPDLMSWLKKIWLSAFCALLILLSSSAISRPLVAMADPTGPTEVLARINVLDKGALGDGKHDDTAAFQAAVDSLPTSGGTIVVPAGDYMINAAQSIRLRDRNHLQLTSGARLLAIPNALNRSYVLLIEGVSDVEVSGGRIIGERDRHLDSTGEWGHGIYVRGAQRVYVHDIHISQCWGDGVCIGAIMKGLMGPKLSDDIRLVRVVSTDNRRQGLSIGPARNITIIDSEFSNTHGTKPSCGIDIEPEKLEPAEDILIVRCRMIGNQGSGIQIYENVVRVTLKDCVIEDNAGYGVLMVGSDQNLVVNNTISNNGMTGVLLRSGTKDSQIIGNTFKNNTTRRAKQVFKNIQQMSFKNLGSDKLDIQVMDDTHSIILLNNKFDG